MTATASRPGPGLAIEAATARVEVAVFDAHGAPRGRAVEEVRHGHTRRLTPLVREALEGAGVATAELAWVAADVGPGSFTGVRVGLATAAALAQAAGAQRLGASSLAALALGFAATKALVVPLIPAGRRDVYAGFWRADARGASWLLAAPRVGPIAEVLDAIAELRALLGGVSVHAIGPGAAREADALERAWPGATAAAWRFEGLSALDLGAAARSPRGPLAGLPAPGRGFEPAYVRPAQAESRVRDAALARDPLALRPMQPDDLPAIVAIERRVFTDAWPESFFQGELAQPLVYAVVALRRGAIVGYLVAWLGAGVGHVGNLAVSPEARRRGVAAALLAALFAEAVAREVGAIALEVRVTNAAAQALYRAHGFRVAGFRHRYYRDRGEDALIMEWRAGVSRAGGGAAVEPVAGTSARRAQRTARTVRRSR